MTITKHQRNLSALVHASTFSRYLIPFGNIIAPLVIWLANKEEHEFVDYNGKQALNFQISLLLYSVVLGIILIPFAMGVLPEIFEVGFWNLAEYNNFEGVDIEFDNLDFGKGIFWWPVGLIGLMQLGLSLVNIVFTIIATIRTHEGQFYEYPATIRFIK
ncbi:DUF4870 domain-containing protein [Zeaxanthinibacter enoshimensis]|uniref:DUF4870 domain-containing protein n=1 Tax=Zeaxanthinibacter enoshimensis TaxID=392009 RepID=A0A4R6TH05_9FLAO|nr:DUF4870 domain-containing protein [Zeaxanthinibacter enoshimensis]TDQ29378.1 hypothetical protein CLV82_2836 [Zeaxanthinibacter enoshimensis]